MQRISGRCSTPPISSDGREFDHLFNDGERFAIGALEGEVMHTPGHTPAGMSYRIGDAVFVGDTMFMPDYGTARADFPGGDARQLYRSIQRMLALPPETRLFMCHDYKAPGRDAYAWETTVARGAASNVHVARGRRARTSSSRCAPARDATLATPTLLLPSIQVNIRAGKFPPAEANGVRNLKVPLTLDGVFRATPVFRQRATRARASRAVVGAPWVSRDLVGDSAARMILGVRPPIGVSATSV